MARKSKILLQMSILVFGLSMVFISCSNPIDAGSEHPNQPPHTSLANIPVNDAAGKYPQSTPTVTLYWVGNDPDGFVTAFRYRWSYDSSRVTVYHPWTTILNYEFMGYTLITQGNVSNVPAVYHYFATLAPSSTDSVVNKLEANDSLYVQGDTVFPAGSEIINPDEGSFIFESRDTLNPHTFEVAAVDNEAAIDPHPASVTFWTPQAVSPIAQIIPPYPADSTFVIDKLTDTFNGISFYFQAIDPYSKGMLYSWCVDSLHWSPFSDNASAVVTGADMKPPYTGPHIFYVRAKNDFGLISAPAADTFNVIVPAFAGPNPVHRILLIDATRNGAGTKGFPTDAELDSYYGMLLDSSGESGKYDLWDVKKSGFPGRLTIAQYSAVVMFDDSYLGDLSVRISSDDEQLLSQYLNVGGKLIMSGWQFTSAIDNPDSFFIDNVHLESVSLGDPQFYQVNNSHDFIGATGKDGYPDMMLDSTKIPSTWNGGLQEISAIAPRGFGEITCTYNSKSDSSAFQGRPVGVRYLGVTYSVVYFGFPLYFVDQPAAIKAIRKALSDIGE